MPAGGFIYINVSGLAEKRRAIATWGEQIRDLSPAWQQIAEDLRGDELQQFTQQGGYFPGSKWPALAKSTIADRIRKGYFGPAPKLFRTGLLLDSLMSQDNPAHIERITPDSLTFGTALPIAQYHQLGTAHMPRRMVLGLNYNVRQPGIIRRINEFVQAQARYQGVEVAGGVD